MAFDIPRVKGTGRVPSTYWINRARENFVETNKEYIRALTALHQKKASRKRTGRGSKPFTISLEDYLEKNSLVKILASDYKGRGTSVLARESDRQRAAEKAKIAQAQRNLARRGKAKDDPGQSAQLSIGRGSKRGRISLLVDDVTSRKKRTRASRISSATGLSIGI